MFGDGSGGMGFVVVSELCRVSMGIVTGMGVSLGLTVPTIMGRGTLAQQERWLPRLANAYWTGAAAASTEYRTTCRSWRESYHVLGWWRRERWSRPGPRVNWS